MELKTREQKKELIRAVINNDDYLDALKDDEIDEMIEIIKVPIHNRFYAIKKSLINILESITEFSNRR